MEEKQDILELPTLGRPFRLGMWYNANKNKIVPSISLWKDDDAHARPQITSNITANTDRTTDDSLTAKMDSLGIRGNFIISALVSTLEVKGSGEYLNDYKTSKTHARVVLKAKGTTKNIFLSMQHFSKDQAELHAEYIERMGATHVVVGITYGYQVFMLLDTLCDSEEEKRKVERTIERKIVEGVEGGTRSHETKEEKKLDELKIKMHGTVQIPTNPVSFQEAIGIYKKIPELAKDNDSPMTVYLLPLASIASSRAKVSSQVDGLVLNYITSVFENISNSEVAMRGIQTSDIAVIEPRIGERATIILTMLKRHKIWLQMKLQHIMSNPITKVVKQIKTQLQNKTPVPLSDSKMEKDSSESDKINEVLQKHAISPFSIKILDIFVSKMEQEVRFMEKLVKMLTGNRNEITVDFLSDKNDFRIPFDRSKVIMLEIPIIREEDNLIKEMQNFDPDNNNGSELYNAGSMPFPFEDEENQKKILKCISEFVQLTYSNKNDQTKNPAKFKCIFKCYKIDGKPRVIHYNAFTDVM